MAAMTRTERYAANLHGVLSCYDRIIVTGTLPGACYAGGMTSFLWSALQNPRNSHGCWLSWAIPDGHFS